MLREVCQQGVNNLSPTTLEIALTDRCRCSLGRWLWGGSGRLRSWSRGLLRRSRRCLWGLGLRPSLCRRIGPAARSLRRLKACRRALLWGGCRTRRRCLRSLLDRGLLDRGLLDRGLRGCRLLSRGGSLRCHRTGRPLTRSRTLRGSRMSLRRTLSPVGRPLRRSSLGSLRLARTRGRERCNLPLERGHAVGKRLNRELRLWAGNLGERHLEHKALVGGHAHLGGGIGEQFQGTRHTVDRAKGLRLAREGRKVVVGGRGYARTHANG